MSSTIYMWFYGLLSPGNIAYLVTGYLLAILTHLVRARMKHRKTVIPWHLVGIAIGVVVIIATSVQSSGAYNIAKNTSQEVQECQRQFNETLRVRARISEENDGYSQTQRKALADWLRLLLDPPPPYSTMATDDPERQAWALETTRYYSRIIQQAQKDQDENFEERKHHQLPEPTCGK